MKYLLSVGILISAISITICIISFFVYIKKTDELEKKIVEENKKIKEENKKIKEENKKIVGEDKKIKDKDELITKLLETTTPFSLLSEMIAKLDEVIFERAATYLTNKKHPAYSTAQEIKNELKGKYLEYKKIYHALDFKVKYLCKIYPDLELYFNDEQSLTKLAEITSIEDLTEENDRVVNYISREEWNELTHIERYQLALKRYNEKSHSNLEIGLQYEMYVDYWLKKFFKSKGYSYEIIPHGIINGINDLGRDIIAKYYLPEDIFGHTLIIQCKFWSHQKLINENVVCQIYGSSIEYKLSNNEQDVHPMIITNIELSDTAKLFAQRLNVEIKCLKLGKYPQIKCNINSNGEKIYHLPFDQQYWKTQIKNQGECYVWTVEDAENLGFRRARKYNPYLIKGNSYNI